MSQHELKTWPDNYKTHDCGLSIRKDDRRFAPGDTCKFLEWKEGTGLTGEESFDYKITGIIKRHVGLKEGYVILLLDGPWGEMKCTSQ